jgi:L-fuconolactonase
MIDSHQHFWRYTAKEFEWLDEPKAALRRDFLPENLEPLLAENGVTGTVAVQARQTGDETEWLLELAARHPFIKGVVGWVPLAAPNVRAILDRLTGNPRLKGVRHVVQAEAKGFLDGEAFNYGVRSVTARGLTYDLLVLAPQLEETIRFVDRHPEQPFVLDHLAKPTIQNTPPAPWRKQLRELARRDRVCCKFSGLVTEAPKFSWTPNLLKPYFEEALAAFGPRRLMIGSDWPVCTVGTDYQRWIEFISECTAGLNPGERDAVLEGTAKRFYRLL